MSEEPWKQWTPEELRQLAGVTYNPWKCLLDFAALLEAEQRGERCVLPKEVAGQTIEVWQSLNGKEWVADCRFGKQGKGFAQEAAILDLARKLRAR